MTLIEKIKSIYPQLTHRDLIDYIIVRDDSDGKGDYIKSWNHPTLTRPTEAQLEAAE